MKIVLTGGGTGGHFYPLIAIAEQLRLRSMQEYIPKLDIYYFSDSAYDELALKTERIEYIHIFSDKIGISFSALRKMKSLITMFFGCLQATWKLFLLYPDVVVSKGGYASIPTSCAAILLGIPLFVHESDAAPGRSTLKLSKHATQIFVSYESALSYFPTEKTIYSGQPVRSSLLHPTSEGAYATFALEPALPILWIMGGSSGAQIINELVLRMLPDLLYHYQIIHQTGSNNYDAVLLESNSILAEHPYKSRYHPVAFLNELSIRRVASVANLVLTRAGSTLFEIASWGIPAIVIPFSVSNADHSRKNAFSYASYGACTVIEESNLSPEVLFTEIEHIVHDEHIVAQMKQGASKFTTPDAARVIAEYVLQICLQHESPPTKPEIPISYIIEEQMGKK